MTSKPAGGEPAPRIAKARLEAVAADVPEGLPPYAQAFTAVVNVEVVPVARVSRAGTGATAAADRLWLEHARAEAVLDDQDRFLVHGADRDWVQVRLTADTALSAALPPGTGSMAIAMSTDGRRLCALTEEDDEYWIVVHRFDAPTV
ncbi:hypothetical protein ACIQUQ_29435 [Streptomyces sp. NPDC101118]|uniref:hypothetical protein n=1 Tax=Streptomyces sp. NPDC101118 TaxID=3366109 RepID=UPI0037F7FDD2